MEILGPIIIISLLVAVGFLIAFLWAVRSGQYDDAETPAIRMLFEDKTSKKPTTSTLTQNLKS
jgi:cbb3-type cytochrome oxidase maturation protein